MKADGSRSEGRAQKQSEFWLNKLAENATPTLTPALSLSKRARENSFLRPSNPNALDSRETLKPLLPWISTARIDFPDQ
ncbi:MAG: hypothetical protein WDN00_03240 [Limisphaerales bacterium]